MHLLCIHCHSYGQKMLTKNVLCGCQLHSFVALLSHELFYKDIWAGKLRSLMLVLLSEWRCWCYSCRVIRVFNSAAVCWWQRWGGVAVGSTETNWTAAYTPDRIHSRRTVCIVYCLLFEEYYRCWKLFENVTAVPLFNSIAKYYRLFRPHYSSAA